MKEEPLTLQTACSEEEIEQLWQNIQRVDSTVQKTDTQKHCLKSQPALQSFMEHCCIERQYFFCIKKCGKEDCDICESPRLPQTEFSRLNFFPDPMKKPASDSYLSFEDVWGKETSKKDRPSCTPPKKPKEKPKKPFRMTAETVSDYVVCLKPRCVYSSKRLTHAQYAHAATVLATRKNSCILVVDLSFLKKAPLLHCVVQNLLVAVMRALRQIIMPPDSLTHHVAMCVVPLATYVQCQMK